MPENSIDNKGSSLKVVLDSALYFGSQLGARALNFIYFMILAWSLPTDEFGILNYAISIVVLIDIAIDLGLSRHAMREMSKHPEDTGKFIVRLIPYKIIAAIIALIGFWIWLETSGDMNTYKLIFIVTSLGLLLSSPAMMLENVLQAHHKFPLISSAHVALSIVQFTVGCAILWMGGSTIAVAMTFTATYFVYLSFMIYGVWKIQPTLNWQPDINALVSSLSPSFPYLCSALVVLLAVRAEFLILGHYGTPIDLGTFGMATKIIEASLLLPLALGTVMAPRFAKAHGMGSAALSKIYHSGLELLLLIAIPTAILSYGLAPIVPILLEGRDFHQIDNIIRILFVGYPVACVFIFNTSFLFGAERQRRPLALLITLAALQIAINIFFQSQYGIWGAAVSFGVFMALAAIGSTIFILIIYAQETGLVKSLITPITSGLCSFSILYLRPFEIEALTILASLLTYCFVVITLRKMMPGGPRPIQLSV